MVDGLAVARQPRRAVHQAAVAHRGPGLAAQRCGRSRRHSSQRPQAGAQDSATWSPGATRVTPGADRLDDAGALVAEHGRAGRLGGAVDRVQVGVADAAGVQPHQHLARPAAAPARARRPRAARPTRSQHRRAHPHVGDRRPRRRRPARCSAAAPRSGCGSASGGPARPRQRRLLVVADVAQIARAAGVEDAAGRRVRGAGDLALRAGSAPLAAVDRRHRREQRLGVRVVRPANTVSAGPSSIRRRGRARRSGRTGSGRRRGRAR